MKAKLKLTQRTPFGGVLVAAGTVVELDLDGPEARGLLRAGLAEVVPDAPKKGKADE